MDESRYYATFALKNKINTISMTSMVLKIAIFWVIEHDAFCTLLSNEDSDMLIS